MCELLDYARAVAMCLESGELDLLPSPPAGDEWSESMAATLAGRNRIQPARRKQPIPEHPDLLTRYTAEEIASLTKWLEEE